MGLRADSIARRSFLAGTLAIGGATSVGVSSVAEQATRTGQVGLRDKFFGCIAGCHIGSAMGAPVEGWSCERIEKEHGLLDKLLPYSHYGKKDWVREPGATEDGVERQKLMITAILEKQDRINAEDLRRAWVDHMNRDAAGLVSEPFEGALLAMAKTHIPATDIGEYCDYSGLVSLSRSCRLGMRCLRGQPSVLALVEYPMGDMACPPRRQDAWPRHAEPPFPPVTAGSCPYTAIARQTCGKTGNLKC